jgi:hypothetical protein
MPNSLNNIEKAKNALLLAWPHIAQECLCVLGSELHYQAMVYHCLRKFGRVPNSQLGMNVKMWIDKPITKRGKAQDKRKHIDFRGGYEPIPDVVIFRPTVKGDWRRRNHENTLVKMLLAIEVKASERAGGRLYPGEIVSDLEKLEAHREEVRNRHSTFFPVMMVIDSAPLEVERMTIEGVEAIFNRAKELKVGMMFARQRV